MNKKSKFQITDDDFQMLNFLWRWKLLSTSVIHHASYPKRSVEKCYRRLRKLESQKFIESFPSMDRSVSLWQLTERGYKLVNLDGIDLSQIGFRAENPEHDFWVSVIHLGAWLNSQPPNSDLYSEQQLRRIELSSYPNWVPHTKQRRPDGWWKIDLNQSNDKSLIALEVEFSKKTTAAYSEIGEFYSNVINVHQVLWVVKTIADGHYIHKYLKAGSSTEASEHSFVLLSDFIQSQYQAKIFLGKDNKKSLNEILNKSISDAETVTSNHWLLDVRKYPINSMTPKIANKADLGLKRYT